MLGRADDTIDFGGIKITPEDIESVVLENPIAQDSACVPLPDELTGQKPALCITLEHDVIFDEKRFGKFLTATIDASRQPQRIVVMDNIPAPSTARFAARSSSPVSRLTTDAERFRPMLPEFPMSDAVIGESLSSVE